jgi:hypothetical protein
MYESIQLAQLSDFLKYFRRAAGSSLKNVALWFDELLHV